MRRSSPTPRLETTYATVLGHVLRARRTAMPRTQGQVASWLGLTQASWSRIERGTVEVTVTQLVRAAAALQTSPHAILGRADDAVKHLIAHGVGVSTERRIVPSALALAPASLARLIEAAPRDASAVEPATTRTPRDVG